MQQQNKKLTELLTTKFKNKYKIKASEKEIMILVIDEVSALLGNGKATESMLVGLDERLGRQIKEARDLVVKAKEQEAFLAA